MKLTRRLALLLACLVFTACAIVSSPPTTGVTPVPTIVSPHRGPVLVQYCVDNTGSYPRTYFASANKLVASNLGRSVIPNSGGLVLYATLISSMTFDPSQSLAPFVIPAIGAYPSLPTPLPTPPQDNPVSYSATATAVANQNGAGITNYNTAMAQKTAELQVTKTQVTNDTKRLTDWNPPIDAAATSVWGCLQLARQRFTGQPGTKYLIIASDMKNNTGVDFTSDFASSQALKGVTVSVIFYVCQTAGACQTTAAQWQRIFRSSGAQSVQFNDPAQSLTLGNLFGGA
jgi:hypothetical protein